jgi:hypothetical protein
VMLDQISIVYSAIGIFHKLSIERSMAIVCPSPTAC